MISPSTLSPASLGERDSVADFSGFLGPHPFAPGDRLSSSLDFVSGQFQAAYRLPWRLGHPGEDFAGLVDVIGGIQFIDINLDASAPSGAISVDAREASQGGRRELRTCRQRWLGFL